MENIKELKEQLNLLQDIISAYETLNKLKKESNGLDRKEYIPYPIYPNPYPYPVYPVPYQPTWAAETTGIISESNNLVTQTYV